MEKNLLVKKISEYIDANPNNSENLAQALNYIFSDKSPKEEVDKLKAAYALNMCTVSISQIVDYNDINILEQEYDAILNNLNLEQIPKDEALLQILKQILDTITYFRIEEVEKEFIERDYQQKIKNAIWSAVPNFGVIIASGNPITAAVSLASQVGIGYMNYRHNKAEYSSEKEKQMWQLRKTAIEQFNALRRELFDTAWRLADVYEFPDEYRLTEKQITQYNKILMDNDEIRKHERLYSIKGKFIAYPPFWYFIGNTAKRISENSSFSEDIRADFSAKAREYFEEFFKLNKYNILREDQMAASGLLEYAEILLNDDRTDKDKITDCINSARKLCGNANDVLQLCAILYLRNDQTDKASEILRILVNEEYNSIINAQLLSGIYVKENNKKDYDLLSTRVEIEYLYPMNGNNTTFENNQKVILAKEFATSLSDFFKKYAIEWNKIIPLFENENYPDSLFAYTSNAKKYRLCEAKKIFKNQNNSYKYCNYKTKLLDIVNEVYNKLFSFNLFTDKNLSVQSEESIRDKLIANREIYNKLDEKIYNGTFNEEDYAISQSEELSIIHIFEDTIKLLCEHLSNEIKFADIKTISIFEGMLSKFCLENGLSFPETAVNRSTTFYSDENPNVFLPEIFGVTATRAKIKTDLTKEIIACIKKYINEAHETDDILFTNDNSEFQEYFNNETFIKKARNAYESIKSRSVAIYRDKKFDLHFTINGILAIWKKAPKELTPYSKAKTDSNKIILTKNTYPVPPSIADVFEKIVININKIKEKYKPANKGAEEHTEIDELFSRLYLGTNINLYEVSEYQVNSTLNELQDYFFPT